jgi:hypothetical protein
MRVDAAELANAGNVGGRAAGADAAVEQAAGASRTNIQSFSRVIGP